MHPEKGPAIEMEHRVTIGIKMKMLVTSVLPVCILILAVLGTIFFGLAAPTEAAAFGAFCAVILAACYKKLTWQVIKDASIATTKVSAMVYMVVIGSSFFTSVFMRLGCGDFVEEMVMGLPFGKWGALISDVDHHHHHGLLPRLDRHCDDCRSDLLPHCCQAGL